MIDHLPALIEVQTRQRFPLHIRYDRKLNYTSASMFLRPSVAERRLGVKTGQQVVFVAGDNDELPRLIAPDPVDGGDYSVWLSGAAFDIDEKTHARLAAWIEQCKSPVTEGLAEMPQ